MGGLADLAARTKRINEATEEPKINTTHTIVATNEPKEVTVKPATTKLFSDGTTRKWDDREQAWVVVKGK